MNEIANHFASGSGVVIARREGRARSGDLARAFPHRDGCVLLFIGDVTGHDDRAADLAGDLETLVCQMAAWMSPGTLLSTLSCALEAAWPSDMFATAVCLSLDQRTGAGTIAVAGQLPPIIRSTSLTSVIDTDGGPPLAIFPGIGTASALSPSVATIFWWPPRTASRTHSRPRSTNSAWRRWSGWSLAQLAARRTPACRC